MSWLNSDSATGPGGQTRATLAGAGLRLAASPAVSSRP